MYPSIDNLHNVARFISGSGYEDVECVATEKIHGANFCMSVRNGKIKSGRRSGWLSANEHFHSYQQFPKLYSHALLTIYEKYTNGVNFDLFFEIFGGFYPGYKGGDSKAVQKEIYYSPRVEIVAIDMRLHTDAGLKFSNFDSWQSICKAVGIPVLRPLARGPFKEVITAIDVNKLPSWHAPDVKPLENSVAEGIVVTPIDPLFYHDGSRFVMKIKSDSFRENHGEKLRPQKLANFKAKPVDFLAMAVSKAMSGVTNHRIASIVARRTDEENKKACHGDIGELVELVRNDLDLSGEKDIQDETKKSKFREIVKRRCEQEVRRWIDRNPYEESEEQVEKKEDSSAPSWHISPSECDELASRLDLPRLRDPHPAIGDLIDGTADLSTEKSDEVTQITNE